MRCPDIIILSVDFNVLNLIEGKRKEINLTYSLRILLRYHWKVEFEWFRFYLQSYYMYWHIKFQFQMVWICSCAIHRHPCSKYQLKAIQIWKRFDWHTSKIKKTFFTLLYTSPKTRPCAAKIGRCYSRCENISF